MPSSPMLLLSATLSNLQSAIFFARRAPAVKILGKKVWHRAEVEPRHQGHAEPRAAVSRLSRSREPRYVRLSGAASRGTSKFAVPKSSRRCRLLTCPVG